MKNRRKRGKGFKELFRKRTITILARENESGEEKTESNLRGTGLRY